MAFIEYSGCKIEYEIKGGKAAILKCEGCKGKTALPEKIEGVPVCTLSRYALSGERELREVILPSRLETIGNLAFYNDRGLKRLSLPKSLFRIGGDAFKNCDGAEEVEIRSERLLRYVLDELSQEITVIFKDENENIVWKLLFPVNAESFSEDVPGRAFHRTFTGPGYTYRRETSGASADLEKYDRLFKRAFEEETAETLCTLAAFRLVYPYKLKDGAKADYESYLKENGLAAAKCFIEKKLDKELLYMTENRLLDEKAAEGAANFARKLGDTRALSRLMDYRLLSFKPQKKKFEF